MGAEGGAAQFAGLSISGRFLSVIRHRKVVIASQPARTIAIPSTRLRPWVDNFVSRHGAVEATLGTDRLRLSAPDGAEALITIPFPEHLPRPEHLTREGDPAEVLVQHVAVRRRLGAVLARKGGFAVGVFDGPQLIASKVGSSYVQGKTKAGGWSQQRYARRRDNQSRKAYEEAADEAVRLLLPQLGDLEAVAVGGDSGAISAVFADSRLADLTGLLLPKVYPVPDPRLRVLQAFPDQFLAVEIQLNELA